MDIKNERSIIKIIQLEEGMYPILPRKIYPPSLDKYHKFILHDSLNFFLKSIRVGPYHEILEQNILSQEYVRKYK